jgi:dTDP-4-amino-4,6-dideoxygalactose transaminase
MTAPTVDEQLIPISRPLIGDREKAAVLRVLDSGIIAQGPETAELERRFAALTGTRHAVATSSGTAALYLALLAAGIGKGDEVITTPFTFVASANSILYVGAKPVFVDIDENTFTLDPAGVERAVGPRTKAILPVHLYGQPCDMDALVAIAKKHSLVIVEDAAQAVAARYKGKPVGSFGIGAFSLYATKNLTSAEGGIITTDDDAVATRARMLRHHGMARRYHHEMLGFNFRLTDIHAAIAVAQMEQLADWTARRQSNAATLTGGISASNVIVPVVRPDVEHVWHQYTIRVVHPKHRDEAAAQLERLGIASGVYYPVPAHKFQHIREVVGDVHMPVAERVANEVLSVPVHPGLSDSDLQRIISAVNQL